ncbi:MAG: phosphoribosylanthranilate isomerase [Caldithrix sp.]|nr:phosphoribosylanthranilate isomerase [Caldithrix sp.]
MKVCCIQSIAEAQMAVHAGADAIGLVSEMPFGPGVIPEPLIRDIARSLPPMVNSVLLSSATNTDTILKQLAFCRTDMIQLVERVESVVLKTIKHQFPEISVIQVLHVTDQQSLSDAKECSRYADAILLDSGNPKKPVRELGGTGRVHDWNISRAIRDTVRIPVILAGGLTPSNVIDAVRSVQPYAVDVCSGVRTAGNLDQNKLFSFTELCQKV